jgi:hypothetical protein
MRTADVHTQDTLKENYKTSKGRVQDLYMSSLSKLD